MYEVQHNLIFWSTAPCNQLYLFQQDPFFWLHSWCCIPQRQAQFKSLRRRCHTLLHYTFLGHINLKLPMFQRTNLVLRITRKIPQRFPLNWSKDLEQLLWSRHYDPKDHWLWVLCKCASRCAPCLFSPQQYHFSSGTWASIILCVCQHHFQCKNLKHFKSSWLLYAWVCR